MIRARHLVAVAALACAGAAEAQDEAWPDDAIWQTVGQTYGLTQRLRARIFEDQAVRAELRRAGIPAGCAAVTRFVADAAQREGEAYRQSIVAEVHAAFPAAPDRQQTFELTPGMPAFNRILRKIERVHPEMFERLYQAVPAILLPEMRALPPATGEWRGIFADWNFESPNQTIWSNACLISGTSDAQAKKLPFDGFYRTGVR